MAIDRWRPFLSTSRWEPFQGVSDIQQEMNRLFDSFFGRPAMAPSASERVWVPLCDVFETKDDLYVTLEVPGVREKEIGVSITGDVLTVKGERKWDKELKDESFHRLERVYGRFERSVPLPVAVQSDKVKATYRDGVLEIRLPKAEETKPRQIKVDIL